MQFKYEQDNASFPVLIQRELHTMHLTHTLKRKDTQEDTVLLDWGIWELWETMFTPEFVHETYSRYSYFKSSNTSLCLNTPPNYYTHKTNIAFQKLMILKNNLKLYLLLRSATCS